MHNSHKQIPHNKILYCLSQFKHNGKIMCQHNSKSPYN